MDIFDTLAFFYVALLMIAVGLTAYTQLLDTLYIWFLLLCFGVPPASYSVLLHRDEPRYVFCLMYIIVCILCNFVSLLIITIQWAEQGSFYLGLGSVTGGIGALIVLIGDLIVLIIAGSFIAVMLSKGLTVTRAQSRPKKL